MVIKGGARGGPGNLANHLERTDENERVTLIGIYGLAARNIEDALIEMDALGAGVRSRRTLYHASINVGIDEAMPEENWRVSRHALMTARQAEKQPFIEVEHEKKGRIHRHVVWLNIDLEQGRAISDSHNYRQHEEVARALERQFGHDRVQGAHVERDGKPRPDRTPSYAEMQQAKRTGLDPKQAKAFVTGLWQTTDSATALQAALESHGWMLAKGDRRDLVLIDPHGETHSLTRRVDAKAAEVRARMAGIDPASLPTVDEARALQKARAVERPHQPQHDIAAGKTQQMEPQPANQNERDKALFVASWDSLNPAEMRPLDPVYDFLQAKAEVTKAPPQPEPQAQPEERVGSRAAWDLPDTNAPRPQPVEESLPDQQAAAMSAAWRRQKFSDATIDVDPRTAVHLGIPDNADEFLLHKASQAAMRCYNEPQHPDDLMGQGWQERRREAGERVMELAGRIHTILVTYDPGDPFREELILDTDKAEIVRAWEAPAFSHDSIMGDPWTAVYLPIPEKAGVTLLLDADYWARGLEESSEPGRHGALAEPLITMPNHAPEPHAAAVARIAELGERLLEAEPQNAKEAAALRRWDNEPAATPEAAQAPGLSPAPSIPEQEPTPAGEAHSPAPRPFAHGATDEFVADAHVAVRRAERGVSRFLSGIADRIESFIHFLSDIVAPPPKLTRDQAERAVLVAEEKAQENADLMAYFNNEAARDRLLDGIRIDDAEVERQERVERSGDNRSYNYDRD